jgi:hypothetical protein
MNRYERALIEHERQLVIKHYKKLYKLSWNVKKAIGCKWWKAYTKEQKAIISDLEYMLEELADYLLEDSFEDLEDYLWCIDCYLKLEEKAFGYKYPLKYEIGKMRELSNLIFLQHKKLNIIDN